MGLGDCNLDQITQWNSVCSGDGLGSKLLSGPNKEDNSDCALPCRIRPWKHPVATALPATIQGKFF
jgi:hypothetical protein